MPTSRTPMNAVRPAHTPPRPQCQCSAAQGFTRCGSPLHEAVRGIAPADDAVAVDKTRRGLRTSRTEQPDRQRDVQKCRSR